MSRVSGLLWKVILSVSKTQSAPITKYNSAISKAGGIFFIPGSCKNFLAPGRIYFNQFLPIAKVRTTRVFILIVRKKELKKSHNSYSPKKKKKNSTLKPGCC
jgi:hypothetical protein